MLDMHLCSSLPVSGFPCHLLTLLAADGTENYMSVQIFSPSSNNSTAKLQVAVAPHPSGAAATGHRAGSIATVQPSRAGCSAALHSWPAQNLPARPGSAMRMLQIHLRQTMQQLKHMVEQGLQTAKGKTADADGDSKCSSGHGVWCCHRLCLQVSLPQMYASSRPSVAAILGGNSRSGSGEQQQQLERVECSLYT